MPDAVQATFDAFGIDSPSVVTRSKLEAWLTAERVLEGRPTYSWTDYGFINLVTLTMLTPEFQLARRPMPDPEFPEILRALFSPRARSAAATS